MKLIILIFDFFKTRKSSYVLSLAVCAFISAFIAYILEPSAFKNYVGDFRSSILTVTGILLGFTISQLAIFISGGNQNIELSKSYDIGVELWNRKISLFDKIIITLCYLIVVQILTLLITFIFPLFISDDCVNSIYLHCFILFLVIHSLFMIISIALDFYLIVSKK